MREPELWVEEPCEHGQTGSCVAIKRHEQTAAHQCETWWRCPGGSRRRVRIDPEAGAAAVNPAMEVITSGRFLVSPKMVEAIVDAALVTEEGT